MGAKELEMLQKMQNNLPDMKPRGSRRSSQAKSYAEQAVDSDEDEDFLLPAVPPSPAKTGSQSATIIPETTSDVSVPLTPISSSTVSTQQVDLPMISANAYSPLTELGDTTSTTAQTPRPASALGRITTTPSDLTPMHSLDPLALETNSVAAQTNENSSPNLGGESNTLNVPSKLGKREADSSNNETASVPAAKRRKPTSAQSKATETAETQEISTPPKRGPGRPKNSARKSLALDESTSASPAVPSEASPAVTVPVKKPRGPYKKRAAPKITADEEEDEEPNPEIKPAVKILPVENEIPKLQLNFKAASQQQMETAETQPAAIISSTVSTHQVPLTPIEPAVETAVEAVVESPAPQAKSVAAPAAAPADIVKEPAVSESSKLPSAAPPASVPFSALGPSLASLGSFKKKSTLRVEEKKAEGSAANTPQKRPAAPKAVINPLMGLLPGMNAKSNPGPGFKTNWKSDEKRPINKNPNTAEEERKKQLSIRMEQEMKTLNVRRKAERAERAKLLNNGFDLLADNVLMKQFENVMRAEHRARNENLARQPGGQANLLPRLTHFGSVFSIYPLRQD